MHPGPLISRWTSGIRKGGKGERERAGRRRGRGWRRRCHCWPAQARRRNSIGRYGAWFCEPKLPGERGGQGGFAPGYDAAGERPRGPRHGRPRRTTPASAAGALEGLVLLSKRTGRERGRRRSSPRCEFGAKTAPNGGTTRGGACFSGDSFLREHGREQKRGEGNWGGEGGTRLSLPTSYPSAE